MMKARTVFVVLGLLAVLGCAGGALKKGDPAPELVLESLDGSTVRLSDYRGRPVLINFWASWCAPCREEMPELQKVFAAQQADGLVILAVNTTFQDRVEDVRRMRTELGLTFPILLDRDGKAAAAYRASAWPTSVFVDRQGRVHLVQVGPMSWRFVESVLREIR
jgi:peroxiredoxin